MLTSYLASCHTFHPPSNILEFCMPATLNVQTTRPSSPQPLGSAYTTTGLLPSMPSAPIFLARSSLGSRVPQPLSPGLPVMLDNDCQVQLMAPEICPAWYSLAVLASSSTTRVHIIL